MNLIADIFAGGTKGVFEGIGSLAKDIREAITGDISAEKKAELSQKAMEIEFASQKMQADINIVEAANPRLFVSGWRPFIGWVGGCALAYHFVVFSLLEWGLRISGSNIAPPVLQTETLMTLVTALLGLGGFRTFEKVKGAA